MSTKPSVVPVWDTTLTNLSTPTSGHKSNGFATNEIPTAAEINGELNQVGQWCKWINDGDLALTGLELAATTYTFASTSVDNVDVSGVSSLDQVGYVILATSTTGPYTVTGLSGTSPGKILILHNLTDAAVTFVTGSSSSSSSNRLYTPLSGSTTIGVGGVIAFIGTQTLSGVHGFRQLWASGEIPVVWQTLDTLAGICLSNCSFTVTGASTHFNVAGVTTTSPGTYNYYSPMFGKSNDLLAQVAIYIDNSVAGLSIDINKLDLQTGTTTLQTTYVPAIAGVGYYGSGVLSSITALTVNQVYQLRVYATSVASEVFSSLRVGLQKT